MIPKVIHYCWFSGEPYPEEIKKCLQSWQTFLPEYEIRRWDASNFDININAWTKEAYAQKQYAFVADYFRFWALYHYGGIYLDADVEVVGTFDALLSKHSFFGFEYGQTPEAAILGAEKGTRWLYDCMQFYADKHFVLPDGNMCITVLPCHMINIFRSKYKIDLFDDGRIQAFKDLHLTVYPYYFFSPKNFYHYMTEKIERREETITIHHFSNSWAPDEDVPVWYKIHNVIIRLFGKRVNDRVLFYLRKVEELRNSFARASFGMKL